MIVLAALVVFLAAFLLAAAAVMVASLFLNRPADGSGAGSGVEDGPNLLKEEELSSISVWDKLLARFDFVEGLRTRIAQADMDWSVGRITAMMLLLGASALALLNGVEWISFWLALVLGGLAALLPYFYVMWRRARRFAQFEEQFPDALDFLARSLRAGHPFAVSLELLAADNTAPLAGEMRLTAHERRLGLPLDQALRNLALRMPLLNVRLFSAAVQLQTRTGGKLSEVLTQLAETMRESSMIQGEVRALAAHGKITGTVLTVLPIGIAAMMMSINPDYLAVLPQHPYGKHLITAAVIALVAAHFIIRKIVNIRL